MKKLLLLLVAGSVTTGVFAQGGNSIMLNRAIPVAKTPADKYTNLVKPQTTQATANKGTGVNPGPRWYSHFEFADALLSQALSNNLSALPIWFDSTVRQRFSTGYGTINFSSVSDILSPYGDFTFNDPAKNAGELAITSGQSYKLDSISVGALYVRMPNYPNVVDTLIISVFTNTNTYYWRKSTSPWVSGYVTDPSKDTLWAPAPINVDSVRRAAYSDPSASAPARLYWKVPLTAAMGDPAATANVRYFNYAPPSAFTVPAGSRIGVTYTFKTGVANWVKNVDSINMFNRWEPVFGGTSGVMPYYHYDFGDRSGSSIMFSTDTSFYSPTVAIEGTNQVTFDYEFMLNYFKLSCTTCYGVGVANVNNTLTVANAYPNPANNTVSIPVTMKEDANVTVSLTNMMGQVIATQSLGQVAAKQTKSATFNTADLATGMYLYTVEAKGQRLTNRVTIAH